MKKMITKTFLSASVALAMLAAPALTNAQTILWESLFNTEGQAGADDGGVLGGFYGGGNPFFQNDAAVVIDTNNPGEGPDNSNVMQATALDIAIGADFAFFGTFIQNAEGTLGTGAGLDLSAATVLQFDLKLGTTGAHDDFVAKLEDVTPTGAGDFDNTTVAITPAPNDTTWTSYSIDISEFLTGGQQVDMSEVSQLTIEGVNPPLGSTIDFDLLIDNVQFIEETTDVEDWELY